MGFFKRLFGGATEPSAQQYAEQMLEINQRFVEWLQVALFKHCIEFIMTRYPEMRPDPIAAHMKLTCTGEGPNRHLENSTPEYLQANRRRGHAGQCDRFLLDTGTGLHRSH